MVFRQKTGSVVCRSCNLLVGVNEQTCYHCGCSYPGLMGLGPTLRTLGADLGFTRLITWGCGLLFLVALVIDAGGIGMSGFFSLLSPSLQSSFVLGASGAVPVFQFHRWWTILSAGWLHGGLIHIGFNLLWVNQLVPVTSDIYGPGRTVIIYIGSSAFGFLVSSTAGALLGQLPILGGAQFTVGASAAIFGLLGALVYAGRRGVATQIGRQARINAVLIFILGVMMVRVDNWAHLGGFVGGFAAAAFMDPLKPERLNHLGLALACIVATVLSIIGSLLTGMKYLG